MALLTGYPGSPISDIFDSIYTNRDILVRNGIVAQIANNEALAVARLNGARMANVRAMAVMKSVGMHVAADGLAIGNLSESNHPEGGAMVIVGDDPWNETTQINSDSRFLAQHLQMPILEPSTFQEIKDWIGTGFELSGLSNLYVAYLITTPQADGGGSVFVRPNLYPSLSQISKTELSSSALPLENFVMIPPHTSMREATLRKRYEKFLRAAAQKGLNRTYHFSSQQETAYPIGFITSGLPFCYLEHALYEMGLSGQFPILKLGVTHPLDKEILSGFLEKVEKVIVIEEKRPFIETQVRGLVQEMCQGLSEKKMKFTLVYGKEFPFGCAGIPEARGINPSILIDRLGKLFLKLNLPQLRSRLTKIQSECDLVDQSSQFRIQVPIRTPTFCPGCPHRDSAVVSLKMKSCFSDANWMKENLKKETEDVIFHGESGCHSMLQFAPNEGLMQNYSGMGLGGGTGAGIDPFIKNKQVVFLGDSTFFHSGMVAVSDAIKNRQNITFVILDNKTTAMTGHQPTPGNDFDILGRKTLAQDIQNVIRGMAGGEKIPVIRADPAERHSYTKLLQELVLQDGVKIVIADKECGITFHRRVRREKKKILKSQGFIPREEVINITPEVCEYCLECTRATGCPGLTVEETDFGPKIVTDLSTCVSDGACTKGKV
ncbi:MAG: indolepyruvate ferredoxin oxidoreductase subunit alpha, partial [Elusimicrobia bacterium]|nr:indolepyruvate ferredoxin oxidoreductase subunit alpha [Elusimicrobiota bacterium]